MWGHVKGEWPHLCAIGEPDVLAAELERVRAEYNGTRLHKAIGYVCPDDKHTGRGAAIRQARLDGLAAAPKARKDRHRRDRTNRPDTSP